MQSQYKGLPRLGFAELDEYIFHGRGFPIYEKLELRARFDFDKELDRERRYFKHIYDKPQLSDETNALAWSLIERFAPDAKAKILKDGKSHEAISSKSGDQTTVNFALRVAKKNWEEQPAPSRPRLKCHIKNSDDLKT